MVQTQKKRRFSTGDRVAAVALAVLVAVALVVGVMQRLHLSLIQGELMLLLPLVGALLLVGWGASALIRRIRNRAVKIAVGAVLGLGLLVVAMIAFTYLSFIATVTLPHAYVTMTSPSGKYKLVVMRSLDTDEDRIRARQTARLEAAAGEASGAEASSGAAAETTAEAASEGEAASETDGDAEITVDDWGYIYTAYPRAARFFYRDDADVQGEAVIGYSSAATLMVEWAADESQARFYVQDPAATDGGEVIVHLGGK